MISNSPVFILGWRCTKMSQMFEFNMRQYCSNHISFLMRAISIRCWFKLIVEICSASTLVLESDHRTRIRPCRQRVTLPREDALRFWRPELLPRPSSVITLTCCQRDAKAVAGLPRFVSGFQRLSQRRPFGPPFGRQRETGHPPRVSVLPPVESLTVGLVSVLEA